MAQLPPVIGTPGGSLAGAGRTFALSDEVAEIGRSGEVRTARVLNGVARVGVRVRIGNAAVPPPPPPPEGETVVEGEIVSIKFEPNRFSHSGARVPKMLVSTGAIRVWSTVPASVLRSAHRGDRVRFVADLKRSNSDERFFFANRPRKAALLAA